MRVTFVSRLAGIFWGGGETFDLETARAMRRLGHEVTFVAGRRLSRLDLPLAEFPVHYVPTPYLRWIAYRGETSRSRLVRAATSHAIPLDRGIFERAALRRIVSGPLARQTDVFQLSALPRLGAWLRERTLRPSVLVWHGPPGAQHRAWNARCSATFSFGAALEAVRRNVDAQAEEIPPGVDTAVFRPSLEEDDLDPASSRSLLRARYGLSSSAVVFAFFGRMIPVKNLPLLLEAFRSAAAEDPRPVLALIGDGPLRSELLERLRSWGLGSRVIAPGRIGRSELPEHYRLCDAVVISSTFETFPLVCLEAMASGRPVIATRVGWLPRMVNHGEEGLLVESQDAPHLAAAIRRLTRNGQERRALGKKGRARAVASYDWQRTAEKMLALYARLRERR